MSLRKPSSGNCRSPLKNSMDSLGSYGTSQNGDGKSNNPANMDDDDDAASKNKPRKSSSSIKSGGNGFLSSLSPLTANLSLPSLEDSSQSPQQRQDAPASITQQQQAPTSASSSHFDLDHHLDPHHHHHKKKPTSLPPPFVIQITAIASLGGVLFGYDMG